MISRILPPVFVFIPLLVLFSGMAMTPLLFIITLCLLAATPRALRCKPSLFYPHYKMLFFGMALIMLPALASYFWSITPAATISTSVRMLNFYLFGIIAFTYSKTLPVPSNKMLYYYGACLVLVSVLVLQEAVLNEGLIKQAYELMHKDYNRFIIKNINRGLCALTLLVWPFLAACYERGHVRKGWLIVAILALALMSMHNLSVKVGLITGVVSFFAFRRFPYTLPRALTVLIPLALLSFPLLYALCETEILTPMIENHLPESGVHRLHIWQVLIAEIIERPWLGWGVDTTRALPLDSTELAMIGLTNPPLHPHNFSIQLLLEEGIFGLLLSVAGITVLLWQWVRMPLEDSLSRAVSGTIIISYITTGMVSYGLWQTWWAATLCITAVLWRWISLKRPPAILKSDSIT